MCWPAIQVTSMWTVKPWEDGAAGETRLVSAVSSTERRGDGSSRRHYIYTLTLPQLRSSPTARAALPQPFLNPPMPPHHKPSPCLPSVHWLVVTAVLMGFSFFPAWHHNPCSHRTTCCYPAFRGQWMNKLQTLCGCIPRCCGSITLKENYLRRLMMNV